MIFLVNNLSHPCWSDSRSFHVWSAMDTEKNFSLSFWQEAFTGSHVPYVFSVWDFITLWAYRSRGVVSLLLPWLSLNEPWSDPRDSTHAGLKGGTTSKTKFTSHGWLLPRAQKITCAWDGSSGLVVPVGSFFLARFHILFVSIQGCSPQTLKPGKLCCKANPCLPGLSLYLKVEAPLWEEWRCPLQRWGWRTPSPKTTGWAKEPSGCWYLKRVCRVLDGLQMPHATTGQSYTCPGLPRSHRPSGEERPLLSTRARCCLLSHLCWPELALSKMQCKVGTMPKWQEHQCRRDCFSFKSGSWWRRGSAVPQLPPCACLSLSFEV